MITFEYTMGSGEKGYIDAPDGATAFDLLMEQHGSLPTMLYAAEFLQALPKTTTTGPKKVEIPKERIAGPCDKNLATAFSNFLCASVMSTLMQSEEVVAGEPPVFLPILEDFAQRLASGWPESLAEVQIAVVSAKARLKDALER